MELRRSQIQCYDVALSLTADIETVGLVLDSILRSSLLCTAGQNSLTDRSIELVLMLGLVTRQGRRIVQPLNSITKRISEIQGSDMVFRPLSPELRSDLYLIWNKYQTFTPIAEKFLAQIKNAFK